MTGGSIKASNNGAAFENSKSKDNKLENVTISSGKDEAPLDFGIITDKESTVALRNVTVSQAESAIFATENSTITVSGGSFDATAATIDAENGSTIILTDNAQITSSDNAGLYAQNNGAISMTGGSITASKIGAGFSNSKSDKNYLENVTISSGKDEAPLGFGIITDKESTVALKNVTVSQAENAIFAAENSTITVSGGSFKGKGITIFAVKGGTISTDNTQVISSDGTGLYANGAGSQITMTGGTVTIKNDESALYVKEGGQIDATNVSLTTEGKGTGAVASGKESTIKLHGNTTINNTLNGLGAVDGGKITSENLTITGGKAINQDPDKERSGLWTSGSGSEIRLTGKTTIKDVDEGFYVDEGSKIISGDLTITGGESKEITTGVGSYESDSVIELNGKTTIENFDVALAAANNSTIKMANSNSETTQGKLENKIAAKKLALAAEFGGQIDLKNISITSENTGLHFLTLSEVDKDKPDNPQKHRNNEINLTNADLRVENGSAIIIGALSKNGTEDTQNLSIGTAKLNKSKIHADVLLGDGILWDKKYFNEKGFKESSKGTFTLTADQSTLEGRTDIAKDRNVRFDLINNTTWLLKTSTKETDKDGNLLDIAQRARSDISVLNLNNSKIVFQGPTEEHYHTLHIGSGKPENTAVYNATGNAKIYFNTAWSDGAASADQKTDRLLIHGDVSGTTAVYIQSDLGDRNSVINAADPSNIGGLSLIQVSGKAQEDSFKLANGYITLGGLPYKYTLTAYGPTSSHGSADIGQNLFDEKNENFWDFRLHKETLDSGTGSGGSGTGSGGSIGAPVAQMANYLVMPNALFYSGLTDITKQNALLANIRTSVLGKEEEKNIGFFLSTYGSTGTLSSARGPLKYGYGADIRYASLQAGATLAAIEGQNIITHFGVVGTYGQLSFTPKDMADVSKSTLDKWSLTAYGSLQHDNGFYLDTLFSYGVFKGDIGNAIMGKTAKVKNAKMVSLSTTLGKQFATGMEDLTFEPQAQLAYQHLMFKSIEDANNLIIDMNNPSQWLIRVGGRLTKTISTENNHPLSFYGKVNFIKTFGDDGSITIGRDFDLDPMGATIEGGLGISAQLSHNLSLHGDVSYQQKLQKTGISGASFSGGIRYQF
ncbi:autotransporter outer membrane beta-barrel domain-containing protein [Bartonella machadoae]|uniref:autotransporter outer membrane beta-barrel domain-containing protein n=1 Tax=Bartonella machadoae TaxID=2893471 RepID=UPI001F4D16FC|nr:autotransporter outer membrane beta-barrel domain-containing protein [Bartonella machadoae]UNE53550.1 autotransporter outer membrane beta-barrel domain-containing protein [Bartonella machadoae]